MVVGIRGQPEKRGKLGDFGGVEVVPGEGPLPQSLEKAANYNSHNALLKGRGVGKPLVLTPGPP